MKTPRLLLVLAACAGLACSLPAVFAAAKGGATLPVLREAPAWTLVKVATGRIAVPAIEEFFAEAGVTHLTALRDPQSALAREMAVGGLPVTVILNPEGQEVGRLIGDADWAGAEARAVLEALMR